MTDFDFSRRDLLRASALLGGAGMIAGLPFGGTVARAADMAGIEAQWPAVTAILDRYVKARKVSGMVAALGWKDAPPGYIARGLEGFDDKDPDGPQSLFRAYSMTKPLTGMAAMILIDEGKLKLDQPLADFAPEFAHMQVAIDYCQQHGAPLLERRLRKVLDVRTEAPDELSSCPKRAPP